jgi:hypothetical protein
VNGVATLLPSPFCSQSDRGYQPCLHLLSLLMLIVCFPDTLDDTITVVGVEGSKMRKFSRCVLFLGEWGL